MLISIKQKIFALSSVLLFISLSMNAQDKGQLSGDLMVNMNLYDYDSSIGTQTQQYLHQLSSSEAWLFLNYRYKGFTVQARYDMFNNSPLLDPQEAFTKHGIGYYSVNKEFGKFSVTGGYFYDQIGSGMIFRAYENRNLGLDYAINGIRLDLHPNDSFSLKAFTGVQKNRFELREQVINGANVEKTWGIGSIGMRTGLGFTDRILDQNTMNRLADQIKGMPIEDRFIPNFNVYAGTIYNTIYFKGINLYTEYAHKSHEATFITAPNGDQVLKNLDGNAFYANVNFAVRGFGVNLQYKKIENFIIRSSPYDNLLVGLVSFLPPLSKQHSFRLPARYSISAIGQGEEGFQGELTYTLNRNNSFSANVSNIFIPDSVGLFREYYLEWHKKFNPRLRAEFGIQSLIYNQEQYEFHPGAAVVHTITPFMEWTYRFKKALKPLFKSASGEEVLLRPSVRTEIQYLSTKQDKGDFAWILLELNFAPKYSFAVSDMINTKPDNGGKPVHYYSGSVAYTMNQTHFNLGYVKQVEGVVCTGGVCRLEPAFSGVRFSLTTNF